MRVVLCPPYYFAYGSNMNLKQMEERCPNAKFVAVGKLKGYKFVYDGFFDGYSRFYAFYKVLIKKYSFL